MESNFSKEKTLVYVDDDKDDIHIFQDAINELNKNFAPQIILKTYKSSFELTKILHTFLVENIIFVIDVNMPKKSGIDLLKDIRKIEGFSTVPVIMYSTYTDENWLTSSIAYNANVYIVKPISFINVLKTIKYILSTDWKSTKINIENFLVEL